MSQERIQIVLMRIIEGFSDYFVSHLKKTYNQTPTSIDVKNISVEKKFGTTGIHLVKVSLDSNVGTDEASIAVKIYDQKDLALEIVKRINTLDTRLKDYTKLGISSAPVIFFSGNVIIMEGIRGEIFRDSKIPKPQKYRYAGRALAAFHGVQKDRVWFDKYKLLLSRSLEAIPVSLELKKSLNSSFSRVLPLAEQASQFSGCPSFGDFHPGNLIFDIRVGRNPMIQTYLIDPEFLDSSNEHDRLEDICNFFAVEAVDLFRMDNTLVKLSMNIKSFLSGYKEILAYNQSNLEDYYSGTYIPLNFHLSLMVLMSILNIQNMGDLFGGEVGISKEVALRCSLIEKLLNDNSFLE
ncbi:MAG: aminoglycoside phosphotransferase family protein [Candidatus Heimdallarchaeota archaeon]|nr:aminoglycoside phosphotransferase family protein [Candidatus Heimdallarchaeota archaeon]